MTLRSLVLSGGLLLLLTGSAPGQTSKSSQGGEIVLEESIGGTTQTQGGRRAQGAPRVVHQRSSENVVSSVTSLAFAAVASGGSAQQTVTLTNVGEKTGHLLGVQILLGGAGTSEAWTVEIDGNVYSGAASNVGYTLSLPIHSGDSVPITVTFQPTAEQYDSIVLRLRGEFDGTGGIWTQYGQDLIDVDVSGLGGHVGDPYLHVVIDAETEVIDYDGDNSESVAFDGSTSHTHEPGRAIVAYAWSEGGAPFSTNPMTTRGLPLGTTSIGLTISDDGSPVRTLAESVDVTVRAVNDVPGALALYYDATGIGAGTLLDAVPSSPDFGEIVPRFDVSSVGGMVGRSSLPGDTMVRLVGSVDLASAGTYVVTAFGGTDRRLEVNGAPVSGPLVLPAGRHGVEARFAVDDAGANMPIQVQVAFESDPAAVPAAADTSHDESSLAPVINSMPTLGVDVGGNLIVVEGLGFHPASGVVVNWGASTLTSSDFLTLTPTRIEFLSPPGSGTIDVSVQTPRGISATRTFGYSPSGPVPIQFDLVSTTSVPQPTAAVWGPDGALYVTALDGRITRIEYSDDYTSVQAIGTYPGVSLLDNHDTLGIAINPHDPPSPVRLYVGHAEHFANGGSTFSGPSAYTGQISVLEGPNFDTPIPVVTGLPTSNHDHAVNGMQFDHNGDLFIAVGSNTNAGVKHPNSGDLPESPLSAAILKAELSKPGFNGAISYVETVGGAPNDDQVFGGIVEVAPGVDVHVHASGLRNPFGLIYTTWEFLYCTDNGPNVGFGAASTGPVTESPDPYDDDELNLIEYGLYYGHPNRNRGRTDTRQNVYYGSLSGPPSIPNVFTNNISWLPSSCNGVDEYRSNTFQGQLRGRLFVQKWMSSLRHTGVSPNGRKDYGQSIVDPMTGGLSVVCLPGGAVATIDLVGTSIQVRVPNDLSAVGTVVHDVFPWRAPATGGHPFLLRGVGFGDLTNTTVTFDGLGATLTRVTSDVIEGVVPVQPQPSQELVDIDVTVGTTTATLQSAFRYLFPAGQEPGNWSSVGLPPLPKSLGEVAAAEIDGIIYVVGEGSPLTLGYDVHAQTWSSAYAVRPFVGHHHSVEVVNGQLYLIGGLGGGSEGKVQVYDPVLDAWSTGADMIWAGGSVSTAVIGGKIYAAGGIVSTFTVNNTAVYDPVLDTWTARAIMPDGRNHAAAATDGARLWVFGGRKGGNFVTNGYDQVMVYDPVTDSWEASGDGTSAIPPMPIGRGGMGKAIWYQDEFYMFGGETQNGPGAVAGNVYDRVDVFDPATNSWRLEEPMPLPRHGIHPVLFESRMFLPGGGLVAGNAQSRKFDTFSRQ